MPQELHVLRCYSCKFFQVHIVKKVKKWQCKICNEKQSVQRVYFQGTGKDCRVQVQNLNCISKYEPERESSVVQNDSMHYSDVHDECHEQPKVEVFQSKWTKYLDNSSQVTPSTSNSFNVEEHSNNSNASSFTQNDNSTHTSCSQGSISDKFYSENTLKENVNSDNYQIESTVNKAFSEGVPDERERKLNESQSNIFDNNDEFDVALDF